MRIKKIKVEINKGEVVIHEFQIPIEVKDTVDLFGIMDRAIDQIKREFIESPNATAHLRADKENA